MDYFDLYESRTIFARALRAPLVHTICSSLRICGGPSSTFGRYSVNYSAVSGVIDRRGPSRVVTRSNIIPRRMWIRRSKSLRDAKSIGKYAGLRSTALQLCEMPEEVRLLSGYSSFLIVVMFLGVFLIDFYYAGRSVMNAFDWKIL